MLITVLVVVAVAVGVFLFVKNNPNKTAQIDQTAKQVIAKADDVKQVVVADAKAAIDDLNKK